MQQQQKRRFCDCIILRLFLQKANNAKKITKNLQIPTIGIGSSKYCDGQILVTEDLVGLFSDFTPKFVKRYADLGQLISVAAKQYSEDVRSRKFPGPEHCFNIQPSNNKKRVR